MLFEKYLESIWGIFGEYLGSIWGVFGEYLGRIFEGYLEGIWGTIGDLGTWGLGDLDQSVSQLDVQMLRCSDVQMFRCSGEIGELNAS